VSGSPQAHAIVYCRGAFRTPNGKTAHGLVRFTRRYRVLSVVDPSCAGEDAGRVLDGAERGIPILASIDDAVREARERDTPATHLVVGLAPDGGRLDDTARADVEYALRQGLHVDSGLHDFLGDDPVLGRLAERNGIRIRDVRKPPPASGLHFFSGRIRRVKAPRLAVLGTDSAVGKRTTAWLIIAAIERLGLRAELIGTGQTAWMQGARYGIVMDSLINDFVSGELEHAICRADEESRPDLIVVEGQGSLLNPAYPGGFEILAAARPEMIVLQHAPARLHYDGFPDSPMDPLHKQLQAIELIGRRKALAITLNHEGLDIKQVPAVCDEIARRTGLPVFAPLLQGVDALAKRIVRRLPHNGAPRPGGGETNA